MSDNKKAFVHLHVHSEYSVLDGLNKVKPLVERVKALGMSACAITDHGTLSGAIAFYKAMTAAELKPIIGMEAYVTRDEDDLDNRYRQKVRDNRHLVLLATNETGFRNLIWLNNQAMLHNFYYNPRIYIRHLRDHSEGLIASSACLAGVVAKKAVIKDGVIEQKGGVWDEDTKSYSDPDGVNRSWAEEIASYLPGRFYIELQDHPNWEQNAYNIWAKRLAADLKLPMVITSDAHYPKAEDKEVHDLLMAQQFKMTLAEYQAKDSFEILSYVREPDDMYRAAAKMGAEEAFWNTRNIAEQCNLKIELGKYETPVFDITRSPDYQNFLRWTSESEEAINSNQ